jgi:hypothetical protein
MHAPYILEEHQRFNSIEGSLGALHFFRQPSRDISVGKRILHVCVGVAFVEQQGQKEGGEKNRGRGLDLESPLHGTCEVVEIVITKPLSRCKRKSIINSYGIGAESHKLAATISACSQTQPPTISVSIPWQNLKSKHGQDMKRVLYASVGRWTTPGRQIDR